MIAGQANIDKTAVVILGMHRSGTSSLAGCMQHRGLYLGHVAQRSVHNPKGNRENPEVMALNDTILRLSQGSWDNPPKQLRWTEREEEERERIINNLAGNAPKLWGFKDPRTILTLSFWREALGAYQCIASFRHPLRVAQSLQARNHIPVSVGFKLWNHYNRLLLDILKDKPAFLIDFDLPPDQYLFRLRQIAKAIGLDTSLSGNSKEFYEPGLISQRDPLNELQAVPQELHDTYRKLLTLFRNQSFSQEGMSLQ